MFNLEKNYQFSGNSMDSDEISWGSHSNKTFMETIEAIFRNDNQFINTVLREKDEFYYYEEYEDENTKELNSELVEEEENIKKVFIPTFGLCLQILQQRIDHEVSLTFRADEFLEIDNVRAFVTDPGRSSYSSINFQSHIGTDIIHFKKGYTRKYTVQVTLKDVENPKEKHLCTRTNLYSFRECVEVSTQEMILKVNSLINIFADYSN